VACPSCCQVVDAIYDVAAAAKMGIDKIGQVRTCFAYILQAERTLMLHESMLLHGTSQFL